MDCFSSDSRKVERLIPKETQVRSKGPLISSGSTSPTTPILFFIEIKRAHINGYTHLRIGVKYLRTEKCKHHRKQVFLQR